MSIRFQLRRLAAAVCLFVQLLALPQAKSQQLATPIITPPEDQYSEDSSKRWIKGIFTLPVNPSAWRFERCLGLGPDAVGANDWFILGDGDGAQSFNSPYNDPIFQLWDHDQNVQTPEIPVARLQLLPQLIAGQIDPSQIQASMCVVLFACRYSDGSLQIKGWRNQASFGINFTQNQFDLRRPNGSPPLRFYATATVHPNDSNGLPVFLNLDLFGLGGSQPQEFGDSGGVKNWLLQGLSQFQTNFNIPYPTTPPVPPEPVTFDQRSFFRLKCYPAPADANGNDIPDVYEATFQDLFISEVCYFNTTLPPDPQNATSQQIFPDWVEIYNPTANDIDMERYAISDSANDIKKHQFYGASIPSGGYLRYYCSGLSRQLIPDPGPLHIGFQLKNGGEHLYLSKTIDEDFSTYQIIDELDIPNSRKPPTHPLANITFGRCIEGNSVVTKYFIKPTPQGANPNVGSTYIAREPRAVEAATVETTQTPITGGIHETGESVVVALLPGEPVFPGTTIVYTLDASEPKSNSTVYTQPITIRRTTVLRFRAFQPDSIPSSVITRTFIFPQDVLGQQEIHFKPTVANEENYSLGGLEVLTQHLNTGEAGEITVPQGIAAELRRIPTVSIISNETVGPDLDHPFLRPSDPDYIISFEWIDPAAPSHYSQENASIHRSGGLSYDSPKGSFEVTFKKALSLTGASKWEAPTQANGKSALFPNSTVTSFNELRLRNPGNASWVQNDFTPAYFSDSFLKETARALGGFTPDHRWVHLYINGFYHGVTDLEEHFDPDFVADHKGIAASGIRILSFGPNGPSQETDPVASAAWDDLIQSATDAADAPNYQPLWDAFVAKINLNDYINYLCTICLSRQGDYHGAQWRAWYDSTDANPRFHFLAWDGDVMDFYGSPSRAD